MIQDRFWPTARLHVGVALAYGLGVVLFRQLSIPHWIILSGFHLGVLLLTRYRYWPALLVGDGVRLAYISITCFHQFGPLWAILNLVPLIVLIMPLVYVCREHWRLFPRTSPVNMGVMVACCFLCACVITSQTLGMILLTPLPHGYVIHYGDLAAQLMLGNYLGILTIAPLALLGRQWSKDLGGSWAGLGLKISESRLLFESAFLALPMLIFLVWLGFRDPQARQVAQIAMFMPVVWLALRHGWQGAALGGMLASFAIMVLMPARNDPDTLQAEVVIAFAVSTMLLVGARIAVLDHHIEQERADTRFALALAQRNIHVGEVQLRATSRAIEQIRETVHDACNVMMEKLRFSNPGTQGHGYDRQSLIAQDQLFRLADSLDPIRWQERGLRAALREGVMARTLDEAGMRYWCELRGPLAELSPILHLALYRVLCEAVGDACAGRNVSEIEVRLRCGRYRGRRWAVLQVDTRADPERLQKIRWNELLPQLTCNTSGLGRQVIVDRAATFEGRSRERSRSNGRRQSVMLLDPA
jgi:two-component system, NarL family, sensor histidine kinase FusK